jgi:poly(A)-specific ribonuclease
MTPWDERPSLKIFLSEAMDVKPAELQVRLPAILDAIASAHFVALDLELSGIPGGQPNRPKAVGEAPSGKPSLQQRYEETKAAAEKYQVLQLGITCVEENRDRGLDIFSNTHESRS